MSPQGFGNGRTCVDSLYSVVFGAGFLIFKGTPLVLDFAKCFEQGDIILSVGDPGATGWYCFSPAGEVTAASSSLLVDIDICTDRFRDRL
mmetsp:Transcript_39963/g.81836  ORF Transcript_39963/g.81836 Transcript_39963/m.81836 type:complete len:90 (+) Transcript_39963:634-903(+)